MQEWVQMVLTSASAKLSDAQLSEISCRVCKIKDPGIVRDCKRKDNLDKFRPKTLTITF